MRDAEVYFVPTTDETIPPLWHWSRSGGEAGWTRDQSEVPLHVDGRVTFMPHAVIVTVKDWVHGWAGDYVVAEFKASAEPRWTPAARALVEEIRDSTKAAVETFVVEIKQRATPTGVVPQPEGSTP